MSADLLADLDAFYRDDRDLSISSAQGPSHGLTPKLNEVYSGVSFPHQSQQTNVISGQGVQTQELEAVNDDDWGDFETANVTTSPAQSSFVDVKPKVNFDNPTSIDHGGEGRFQPTQTLPRYVQQNTGSLSSRKPKLPRDESVLFDAEEDFEEDEFGDFESTSMSSAPTNVFLHPIENDAHQTKSSLKKSAATAASLIDFDDGMGQELNQELIPKEPETHNPSLKLTQDLENTEAWARAPHDSRSSYTGIERSPINEAAFRVKGLPSTDLTTTATSMSFTDNRDDEWDEFEDGDPPQAEERVAMALPKSTLMPTSEPSANKPAPTNIPPPAVLLPVFAPLILTAKSQLFDPISKFGAEDAQVRDAILSHPQTQSFLSSFISIGVVLGRIIAGRKHRWKRDTILSQSMRIGPAGSSNKGGMKLVSIDKGENTKEEKEASDAVRIWKSQVGKLRSVVASYASIGPVPEINENPMLKTVTTAEGGLTAPKPCGLCGLKRNERVIKIDIDVQDSFGEWWVEHWGHRTCRNFWYAHESDLQGR